VPRDTKVPDFDIWSEDVHKPGYVMSANNEQEAIGRARERWNLPNDLLLVPMLRAPDNRTLASINVADYIHKAATVTFMSWQAATVAGDNEAAARLGSAYKLLSRAYTNLIGLAGLVDEEAQATARLEATVQTYNTYSDPSQRPETSA
jgi:hypothetical protein